MSDETRQTRLLSFRPRGTAGRPVHEARASRDEETTDAVRPTRGDAGGRAREDDDPELSALLAEWGAPDESPGSAGRLLSAYRETAAPRTPWGRLLSSRVGVPVPLAACFTLALAASLLAHAWGVPSASFTPAGPAGEKGDRTDGGTPGAFAAGSSAADVSAGRAEPEVRYVEVPVPGETRVVYVERKRPGAGGRRVKDDRAVARAGSSAGDAASYFTPVDMAEFKPADEVKIRVVRKGER
ncbi:MAG TPA: hypothetical protein VEY09_05905 [Pyrinomonadaceae bacterium]|nr:hypothetical protein [Pyrinomonadaceae bacterium]